MRAILDSLQANRELTDLAKSVGLTMRDLMYDQGRLLAQDGVRKVKPGAPSDGPAAQKDAGYKAVESDVRWMFWGVDKAGDLTKWWREMNERGTAELSIGTRQGQRTLRDERLLYKQNESDIAEIHRKHRDKKGRVKFRHQGDELAGGKYVTTKSLLNRYIRKKQKKVGQLKAGFVAAADHFATLAGTTAKSIPAWVRKQAKKNGGYFYSINKSTGQGFLEVVNEVLYSEVAIPTDLRASLERTRQIDIEKSAIKRINRLAKDHNYKHARAA